MPTGVYDRTTANKVNRFGRPMTDYNKKCIKEWLNKKYASKYTATSETIGCEYKIIPGFSKYIATYDGRIFYKIDDNTFRLKNYSTDKNNYQICCLTGDSGKNKVNYAHRWIAKSWLENHNAELVEVDHIDHDRCNQRVDNLRWCTRTQNINNRKKRGTK